jgi:rhodanese-related sulfurtransferase
MIEPFQAHLNENGIEIAVGAETEKIDDRSLTLKDGRVIDADLVVSSVGVVAESKLAELAGLEMGDAGGIKVDENLRTSDPNIFAVGDAVEKRSLVTNQQQMIWLANLANRHGRLVADAIAGEAEAARKSIGTGIIGAFGMAAALTGITEGLAQRLKISYKAIHLHPSSHAGYFPGAERISLKVLFDPSDGKLLGAQAVGKDGADKRIDIIATAIYAGLTINDLMNLELAYSPQYGSAKDAVNHAGYVGNNVLSEKSQNVHWNQLPEEVGRGVKILDVRTQSEFDRGHIPGAILAPVDELRDKLDELEGHEYIVHCAVGQRAHTAIQILKNKGIEARNLSGGYTTWKFAQDALARGAV